MMVIMQMNRSIKKLPLSLKLSMMLLLASCICFDARNLYQVITGEWYESIDDLPELVRIVNNLGFALFWVNHWLFTSHYLKAAYLLYLSL